MTTEPNSSPSPQPGPIGWKLTLLICILVLFAAAGGVALIFSTEPEATRTAASRETAMLVDVVSVSRKTHHPEISAMGTVQAARDITLRPRVSGEIVERAPAFTPGGFAEKGEMLLVIDPADYQNTLQQQKSDLRRAVSDLKIEMGRQNVARQDYALLDETLTSESKALVLRKPQLNAARAAVESARAAVAQAEFELSRTRIKAPFDAHILARETNIGSQVAAGDRLGRIVGVDTYWVAATVPLSRLRWLSFPEGDSPGSPVKIRNRSAWKKGVFRQGRLYQRVGDLADQTRMAQVIVAVDDPLNYRHPDSDRPELTIGAFVEARIRAVPVADAFRLDRDYVRQDDTVWVFQNGKLDIRDVEIVLRNADYAYIESGLAENDQVVTSNLATIVDGAPLRLKADSTGKAPGK
ncbi:MAG: efflux RND transporter periplasmic adaptor subunit [Thermodesulfobacteriota bacterium]